MAEEEAQAPEENAAADGEAQAPAGEAGQAPEEAAAKPPSMLVPMLLTSVLSIGGAFAIFKFAVVPSLVSGFEKVIIDNNGSIIVQMTEGAKGDHGKGDGGHGEGGGDHGEGGGDHGEGGGDHGEGGGEGGGASKTETKPGTPVPIVEEGEFIVVNPAGSTRYLMVEILLIRKNSDDNGFPTAVKENRKRLEAQVSNILSALSAEDMSEPSVRNGMPNQLKGLFQAILGTSHPIQSVIIPKWVMQ
ncbi:MAG: flagellar basal body-associated FliL family protein [Verrucomicrobiota bacterium]|nr:flagellar basal body-associated FliL family protein [Verrucomicrobiota bacterium]